MPSVSPAQHRLMEGIAHGWHPSSLKHAPSVAVAKDFVAADKAKKHAIGAKLAKTKTSGRDDGG